jgi:hypothetical protein
MQFTSAVRNVVLILVFVLPDIAVLIEVKTSVEQSTAFAYLQAQVKQHAGQ